MQRNDGGCGSDAGRENTSLIVDRRSYLKLAGVVAGSASFFSGTASAAERRGIRFNHVVDMVADAGCDPTGQEPCDAKIRNAAADYTLLKFPAGTYKLTEKNVILDKNNLGFIGENGATFTVPEWFNEKALVVERGTGLLFENIDVDLTAYGATPGLHLAADNDLQIHDVEYIGQGVNPNNAPQDCGNNQKEGCHENESVTKALYPIVRSPDGVGIVRNVVARNAGYMGTYTRTGVWIGSMTEGTIKLQNCRFEEFPGNGLYCSRTYGVVQVEGGEYRNNDISQVRIGSQGSYVENAIIDVGATETQSPNPEDALNQRGVWFESRKYGGNGPEVRNCEISMVETPNSSGGVVTASTVGDFSVLDTRIGVDVDGVRGIYGYSPTDEPHSAIIRNTSITGGAAGGRAVWLKNHPDSVVDSCCIYQEGMDRDGVRLDSSSGTVVQNSVINVTDQQIDEQESSITTNNISAEGSCSVPVYGAGDDLPNKLSIESDGGRFSYTFSVSGDLGKSTARGATIDDNDSISKNTATGQGGSGGVDSYGFSGTITDLNVSGDAVAYVNGEKIDTNLDHTLVIEATGPYSRYAFSVSDRIGPRHGIAGKDTINGSSASGAVGGEGLDSYGFSGAITDLDTDRNVNVYVDGEQIDAGPEHTLLVEGTGPYSRYEFSVSGRISPRQGIAGRDTISGSSASGAISGDGLDSYGFSGELLSLDADDVNIYVDGEQAKNTLTIKSSGDRFWYHFSVSGDLKKSTAMDASKDDKDVISGSTATGRGGGGGADSYEFLGEITDLRLAGDAVLYLNGEKVSPERFLPRTLTVEASGSYSSYEFTTTDGLAPRKGIAGKDTVYVRQGRAAGAVGGSGRDSYSFAGEITDITVNGNATVYVDGRRL